ncbi:MAG: hypothetical protein H0U28_15675 [Nocardioidaceae bacterium]|nr:hypothetical protein [Nocardioidaceae bacterium]
MLSMTEPFLTAEINYRHEKIRDGFAGAASRRQLRKERRRQRDHRRQADQHLPVRASGTALTH